MCDTPPLCLFPTSKNAKMKRVATGSLVFALFSLLLLWNMPPAHADTAAAQIVPIALAPVQRTTPVELVALTLDANLSEHDGHTLVSGNSTFKLHNTDRMNDVQIPVGFPTWAGDPYAFDPARLDSFSVSVEGKKVTLNPSRADLRIGSVLRNVDWYTFTLPIAADEKKTVRFDFQQDLGDGALPRFAYGLVPAAAWKGSIGSARLTIRFPAMTEMEQLVSYDPANLNFDGTSVTWSFQTHEPPVNPSLTVLRPSIWQDLVARRRSVGTSPNDAGAHASLGSLLRQLASLDSPRRDSYATQAIAEFELASRLDATNRTARQGLANLYELRAGPAAGPRLVAYVSLAAAQWQALAPTDAGARKQLAEDYFYLGVEAQTRGAFDDAVAYYDKAAREAPNGAGPLYTPEHASAQRRSLNIAWARNLLDQDDVAAALDKARAALGESFVTSLELPPFYVAQTQVQTSPTSRTTTFRLVPFGLEPDELQNELKSLAANLSAARAQVSVQRASDGPDSTLAITIPLDPQLSSTAQLSAVAKALPADSEWSLVRTVVAPPDLTVKGNDQLWTETLEYREEVDLSIACGAFQARLDAVNQGLAPLENAAAADAEAQLKRALWRSTKTGWQQALSSGTATFQAGGEQVRVDACTGKTIAWSSSGPALYVAALAGLIAAGIAAGLAALILRGRNSRRRKRASYES